MKREYQTDIGWGVFFLALAVFVWVVVPYQIPLPPRPSAMGPRFFPRVISLILGFTSASYVLSTLLKHRKEERRSKLAQPVEPEPMDKNTDAKEALWGEMRAALVLITMVVYAILMPIAGFIISSVVTGGVMLVILGARKWYYYIILFAAVYLVYYVFRFHLYVQLP